VSGGLARRWVHVREEDTAGVRVYRPADRPLPPARGRDGLDLRADGTYVELRPGPADAPVGGPAGRWHSDSGRLALGVTHFEIVELTNDILKLRLC
jgi:hypothetical protein